MVQWSTARLESWIATNKRERPHWLIKRCSMFGKHLLQFKIIVALWRIIICGKSHRLLIGIKNCQVFTIYSYFSQLGILQPVVIALRPFHACVVERMHSLCAYKKFVYLHKISVEPRCERLELGYNYERLNMSVQI